jgi:GTP-binding protein Era
VGERLVAVAGRALSGADLIYWLVDCRRKPELTARLLPRRPGARVPSLLLLNKIDLIPRTRLLPLIDYFRKLNIFREIIPVSALKGDNVGELLKLTWPLLPSGRPLFNPDQLSDQPERELLREFIRERIFLLTNQEIPYSSAVKIEEVREGPERRKIFVQAVVYVERESQKGILIGKKGVMIKRIGQAARRRMEEFLARPVYLDLRVKVRSNWRKKAGARRELL